MILNKDRLPKFELLRIISMLLIVQLHFMSHGGVNEQLPFGSLIYFVFSLLRSISYLGVNCFVLITGYFLCKSTIKLSRIIRVTLQVLFYSITCTFIFVLVFKNDLSVTQLVFSLFPISSNKYWFASMYVVLLFLSPVLNSAVSKMDKKEHLASIILMLIGFSIIPTFMIWGKDVYSDGKDIGWFISLYLIAAFIRNYPLKIKQRTVYCLFGFCLAVTVVLDFAIHFVANQYAFPSPEKVFYYNNSPFIALASVLLLIWASRLERIPCQKMIVLLGAQTFGVYLLHDNDLLRNILWSYVKATRFIDSIVLEFGYMIAVVICIFCIGCITELIRKKIVGAIGVEEKVGKAVNQVYQKLIESLIDNRCSI